jgi:hypothetical protein
MAIQPVASTVTKPDETPRRPGLEEKFPSMSDAEVTILLANVVRLTQTGSATQKVEAQRLHPLVVAELAERRAKAPPKAAKARKPAKPKQDA